MTGLWSRLGLVGFVASLAFAASARAECAWVMWYQHPKVQV